MGVSFVGLGAVVEVVFCCHHRSCCPAAAAVAAEGRLGAQQLGVASSRLPRLRLISPPPPPSNPRPPTPPTNPPANQEEGRSPKLSSISRPTRSCGALSGPRGRGSR